MTATAEPTHDEIVASWTGGLVRPVPRFEGSDRLRPDGRAVPALRSELREISNGRNALTCGVAILAPIVVIATVASLGRWWLVPLAVPVIATLQLRMFVLHHEAAHRLLFSNRRCNDLVGINLMGWLPLGSGEHGYRRVHQAHHRDEFGPNEPDFLLYSFYPIGRVSFLRKLRRDMLGVSAWRILSPRLKALVVGGDRVSGLRTVGMQLALLALFWAAGIPWLYLWLWVVPYLTWYQVINRLRAVAEHGGMTRSADRRETSHIVQPSWLSRILIAPLNVAYHLPHHVDSGVPFRNLPRFQQIMIEDGYVPQALVWPSYRALWKAASSGDSAVS